MPERRSTESRETRRTLSRDGGDLSARTGYGRAFRVSGAMQGQYLPRVRPTSFSATPAVVRQRAAASGLDPGSIRNLRSGPVKIADWTSGRPQGGRALLRG